MDKQNLIKLFEDLVIPVLPIHFNDDIVPIRLDNEEGLSITTFSAGHNHEEYNLIANAFLTPMYNFAKDKSELIRNGNCDSFVLTIYFNRITKDINYILIVYERVVALRLESVID